MAELYGFTPTSIAPASLPDLPEPPYCYSTRDIYMEIQPLVQHQLPRQILTFTKIEGTVNEC